MIKFKIQSRLRDFVQCGFAAQKEEIPVQSKYAYHSIFLQEVEQMSKYACTVCDYVYDPEAGDPDNGIAPGTPFEKLPGDWVCPVCGVAKDEFEKV